MFSDHLSVEEARADIAAGLLFEGRLRLNPRNSRVAYVTPEAMPGVGLPLGVGMDIMIEGPKDRNRALEGDVVAVRLHEDVGLWGGNNGHNRRRSSSSGGGGGRNGGRGQQQGQQVQKADAEAEEGGAGELEEAITGKDGGR